MKKNYILDTNIFIYDPDCLFLFEDNDLFVAPVTIRELDGKKESLGEAGYSAREAARRLDALRATGNSLKRGLPLGKGLGTLYAIPDVDFSDFTPGMSKTKNDDYILAAAAWLTKHSPEGREVILVTDDTDMALLADIIDVKTEHFLNKRTEGKDEYAGRRPLEVEPDTYDNIFQSKGKDTKDIILENGLIENEFLAVTDTTGRTNLARVHCPTWHRGEMITDFCILPVSTGLEKGLYPWEIYPKNAGQRFMIDAMMDPSIPLVIIKGPAGTAKTFITLACGLQQTVNDTRYKQVLITRANVEMDASYGYIPGDEAAKIEPMMRPFWDNLNILMRKENAGKTVKDGIQCPSATEYMLEQGYIKAESMQYMRGRSITDTYVIIDEAQNCTPNQILSIVSRIGEGSKIILLGDPDQIDNKILDKHNNGLVFASHRFIGSTRCAQLMTLQDECVRSALAAEAAVRLKSAGKNERVAWSDIESQRRQPPLRKVYE